MFAIVRVIQRKEECTNLGGEDYVLELADGTGRFAHAGGHGFRSSLIDERFDRVNPKGADPTKAPGRLMVAELKLYAPAGPDANQISKVSHLGPCLDSLPSFAAGAVQLLPARDEAEAKRLLERVQRLGMPPSSINLVAERPTRVADEISIARVTAITSDATGLPRLELVAVDGAPRPRIAISSSRAPMVGDFVIIASARKVATRMLQPDDLAAARRWAADIRRDGWPVAAIDAGDLSYLATERWTVLATVEAGSSACGPTIRTQVGQHSNHYLPEYSAAAPGGLAIGERVLAIVVALRGPAVKNACGRTTRVVRAYRAPQDFTADKLAYPGIPTGLTPIYE